MMGEIFRDNTWQLSASDVSMLALALKSYIAGEPSSAGDQSASRRLLASLEEAMTLPPASQARYLLVRAQIVCEAHTRPER